MADVNRNFDMAWREAYGVYDNPERFNNHQLPPTDWATDGIAFRDGFYFADSYSTTPPAVRTAVQTTLQSTGYVSEDGEPMWLQDGIATGISTGTQAQSLANNRVRKIKSPFYLTVDSQIDQAPSVDAVAASRLRGLNVTHVNHLMQQDANRLADSLGLANVDAATIRRWQSECRLVCRVPQLRGFDARVLVGCGVTDPAHLTSIHPADLLDRVEAFLATDAGQRILRSGSSFELARITSWIAAGNSSNPNRHRSNRRDAASQIVNGRVIRGSEPTFAFDSDRYEYEVAGSGDLNTAGRRQRRAIRTIAEDQNPIADLRGNVDDRENSYGRTPRGRSSVPYYVDGEARPTNRSRSGVPRNGTSNHAGNGNGNGGNGVGRGYGAGNGNGARRSNADRDTVTVRA